MILSCRCAECKKQQDPKLQLHRMQLLLVGQYLLAASVVQKNNDVPHGVDQATPTALTKPIWEQVTTQR